MRATSAALALASFLGGTNASVFAKTAGQPPAQVAVITTPPPPTEVTIVEGGQAKGQTTPEAATRDGLTIVDLSDEWLPFVFSEEPGKPQPLRPYLVDLANERFRGSKNYARAREDKHFESFGVFPSLSLLRRRLADRRRHACHDRVKDAVLEAMPPKSVIVPEEPEKPVNANAATGSVPAGVLPTGADVAGSAGTANAAATPAPPTRKPLSPEAQRAVVAMQAHLRCEELLPGKAKPARMDMRTVDGLKLYQRLHMLADNGRIDLDTRTVLLADSREHDFRALLRALRERVVDATGLLEDGSALGVSGEVQGRVLDSAEFRSLPIPAPATTATGSAGAAQGSPPASQGASPGATPSPTPPAPVAVAPVDPQAKITAAPDLISAATHAASQALGWTSPEAVLASTLAAPPPPAGTKKPRKVSRKGPLPLPPAVAIRLAPLPAYHSAKMDLRAEIDRGEVVLERPKLDKDGHKKWKPPVADRPTLTLYARVGDKEVALSRWPTTIGGWKTIQKSDGTMALKYKESVTGEALWPEVLATPSWHPAPGMPTRKLLVKRGDTWEPKTEIIGPGYRAAYGLVAIVHHQIVGVNEKGEQQLEDLRIRTHGTPAYRSVKRGESNGCHRLHNYLALRLASFVVKHRPHVRDGLVPEDYVRNLEYQGQKVALESESKGYRFKLTPPVPITVLDGDVKGDAKAVKRMVPLAAVP